MKAIQIAKYGERLKLKTIEIPPKPSKKQILIKMRAAPINPTDIYYSKGIYGIRKALPTTIGFEGSGVVVDAGEELDKNFYLNKRVAAWHHDNINSGTWAEYFLTESKNCIVLEPHQHERLIDYCCPFQNPATALAFLEIAKKHKAETVAVDAGSSALGKMIIQLFKKNGIKVISIIRNDKYARQLKQMGADFIFNQNDEKFLEFLGETLYYSNCKIFFDCVGGKLAADIFHQMPKRSFTYLYGVFSMETIQGLNANDFLFKEKSLKGFWLNRWVSEKSVKEYDEFLGQIKDGLDKELGTKIGTSFALSDINKAIIHNSYNSGEGKTILQP